MENILIVDDEISIHHWFDGVLEDDYSLLFASNATEALEILNNEPDIIVTIIDIHMPGMDGLSLLDEINELDRIMANIIISSDTDMANIRTAMNKEAFDFLLKPLVIEDVKITLDKAIKYIKEWKSYITEKNKLEDELYHSKKIEALGTLAGGTAHEFNNLLFIMLGNLNLLERFINEEGKQYCNNIKDAGKRATDIIHQILAFTRQDKTTTKKTNIIPVIKNSLKILRTSIPTNIDLDYKISTDSAIVECNETQVHQILINICKNAEHAMGYNSGKIQINVEKENGYIQISIEDNGCGIPKENIKKIFDPFFTTKKVGNGSGLGLSVIHGIVNNYNGSIDVESQLKKGTKFIIHLPYFKTEDKIEEDTVIIKGDKETILLVDDEKSLLDALEGMLTQLGYEVIAEQSSPKALEKLEDTIDDYDLLITDQGMPDMSGLELIKRIRELDKNFPIILMSGSTVNGETMQKLNSCYLSKPASMEEISKTIHNALNSIS